MLDIKDLLRGSYTTRGGKIDPWGTIRILDGSVPQWTGNAKTEWEPFCLHTGLPIWSEKLVPYGNGGYHAKVTSWDTVHVLAEDDSVVEEIPYENLVPVNLSECHVHKNGYLQYNPEGEIYPDGSPWYGEGDALDQAMRGENPRFLDNSPFTRVDEKLAGKEVIRLECDSAEFIVFTKEGERLESKTHHPLSFAKWAPKSEGALYSVADETCN